MNFLTNKHQLSLLSGNSSNSSLNTGTLFNVLTRRHLKVVPEVTVQPEGPPASSRHHPTKRLQLKGSNSVAPAHENANRSRGKPMQRNLSPPGGSVKTLDQHED